MVYLAIRHITIKKSGVCIITEKLPHLRCESRPYLRWAPYIMHDSLYLVWQLSPTTDYGALKCLLCVTSFKAPRNLRTLLWCQKFFDLPNRVRSDLMCRSDLTPFGRSKGEDEGRLSGTGVGERLASPHRGPCKHYLKILKCMNHSLSDITRDLRNLARTQIQCPPL